MEIAVHRLALTVLAAALAIPTSTLAQDIAGEISFDFAVGTDNRSKGASKSEGDPFGLAGIEWSSSDFYVVAEGETVDHANGSQLEAEINAGWRPKPPASPSISTPPTNGTSTPIPAPRTRPGSLPPTSHAA